MKPMILAGLIGLWAGAAAAHSPLEATTPAADAVIAQVPEVLAFDFKNDIRLTRVTMTHADADGVDLDLSGHEGFMTDYAIPLSEQDDGIYLIEWRGLGVDGHPMTGSFSFTVQ